MPVRITCLCRRKGRGESGFSLLEVLVATALMAMMSAILLQIMTVGLRAQKSSLDQSQALEVASQVLQEFSVDADLVPGKFRGNKGPYTYLVNIRPQYHLTGRPETTSIICYLLTVTVSWKERGRSKVVELHTMRTVVRRAA